MWFQVGIPSRQPRFNSRWEQTKEKNVKKDHQKKQSFLSIVKAYSASYVGAAYGSALPTVVPYIFFIFLNPDSSS